MEFLGCPRKGFPNLWSWACCRWSLPLYLNVWLGFSMKTSRKQINQSIHTNSVTATGSDFVCGCFFFFLQILSLSVSLCLSLSLCQCIEALSNLFKSCSQQFVFNPTYTQIYHEIYTNQQSMHTAANIIIHNSIYVNVINNWVTLWVVSDTFFSDNAFARVFSNNWR